MTGEEERIDRLAWSVLARRAEQPTYSLELVRTIAAHPGDGPAVDARLAEIVAQIRAGARLLPADTYTVEQFNSRLYRNGVLMDEPDTAETREHAQARVDWHARKREAEPGWPGVAVLVRRYQHTTPWTAVEETP